MILAAAGSDFPIFWVVIGALLVVRLAIGVGRRRRRDGAGAPVPTPPTPALDAIRPVAARAAW